MRKRTVPAILIALTLIALGAAVPARAAETSLRVDTGFGSDGVVAAGMATPGYRKAAGVAVAPDGKILVAAVGDGITSVARYLPGGELDPAYGEQGVSQLDSVPAVAAESVESVGGVKQFAVDSQGRALLLLRGTTLVRLTPGGAIDTAWSERATEAISRRTSYAMAVQDDGRVLVAGPYRFAIRLTADGSLDSSFGQGGATELSIDGSQKYVAAKQATVARDGRILVSGTWHGRPAALRLLPNGAVDRSFGRRGWAVLPSWLRGEATALTALPNGATLLSCDCSRSGVRGALLPVLRLGPAGGFDRRFSATSLAHRVGKYLRPHLVSAAAGRTFLVGGSLGSTVRVYRRDRGPTVVTAAGVPRNRLFGVFAARQGKKLLVAWTPKHKAGKEEIHIRRFILR